MNVLSKLPLEIRRIYQPKEKYIELKYCALVLKFFIWVWGSNPDTAVQAF